MRRDLSSWSIDPSSLVACSNSGQPVSSRKLQIYHHQLLLPPSQWSQHSSQSQSHWCRWLKCTWASKKIYVVATWTQVTWLKFLSLSRIHCSIQAVLGRIYDFCSLKIQCWWLYFSAPTFWRLWLFSFFFTIRTDCVITKVLHKEAVL